MEHGDEQLREMAVAIIKSRGRYARMTALFRSGELANEGDAIGAVVWRRIADIIAELEGRPSRTTLH